MCNIASLLPKELLILAQYAVLAVDAQRSSMHAGPCARDELREPHPLT